MKNHLIILALILYGCAAQMAPNGGPLDQTGPSLVDVSHRPSYNIFNSDEKIVFTFDEFIDPLSVVNSIKVFNFDNYTYQVRGKKIILEQKIKAESDPAVAAASILARDCFIRYLLKMGKKYQIEIPRGASNYVRNVAEKLVKDYGPNILSKTVKCHFKTTDQVLESTGFNRNNL